MGYVPVRDPSTGKIVDMVRDGVFVSDDGPGELSAAPATAAPAAAPSPERPRRRSRLDEQLSQQTQRAQWGALVAAAVCAVLLYLAWPAIAAQLAAAPSPAPVPTAGQAPPTAAPPASAAQLPAAMVAYDRPGGTVIGALEPGRPFLVVAHSGEEWLQLDVGTPEQPNLVWTPAWDGAPAVAGLLDLATPTPVPTATPVPYVAPAWAPLPDPAYVAPTAIPQATCKAVILDGEEIGQACGYTSAEVQATAQALLSTPRGAVPVEVATSTPFAFPSSYQAP